MHKWKTDFDFDLQKDFVRRGFLLAMRSGLRYNEV
jgi:hypothetical protein